jgi:hypothetical protein
MSAQETVNVAVPERDLLDRALRESVAGRLASTAAARIVTAWGSSISGHYLFTVTAAWRAVPTPTRVRLVALVGAIAMGVHLAMARLGPREPLGAVVPTVIIAACALSAVFAGPIARASERIAR